MCPVKTPTKHWVSQLQSTIVIFLKQEIGIHTTKRLLTKQMFSVLLNYSTCEQYKLVHVPVWKNKLFGRGDSNAKQLSISLYKISREVKHLKILCKSDQTRHLYFINARTCLHYGKIAGQVLYSYESISQQSFPSLCVFPYQFQGHSTRNITTSNWITSYVQLVKKETSVQSKQIIWFLKL